VTITGQYVNVNIVRAVYFGKYKGYLDTNRLSSSLFITIIIGIGLQWRCQDVKAGCVQKLYGVSRRILLH